MAVLKGWRTRLFSCAVALLGLLEFLDPSMIVEAIGADNKPLILLLIAALIFILRQVTTTPPGTSA